MRSLKRLTIFAGLIIGTSHTFAGVIGGDGSAGTQFRRTIDPSPRAAVGSASFHVNGAKETCTVDIKGLGETDFGIFIGDTATPDTNTLVLGVAPLDRTSIKNGSWHQLFKGNSGAPLEFPVETLHQLSGGILVIGRAGDNNLIQGVTNIVGGVTNILVGIPLPQPNVTNTIGSVLWAPIPAILPDAAPFNFRAKGRYGPVAVPSPSPRARATVKVNFTAATGRSVLDVRANNLLRGQTYTLFIADSTNNPPSVLISAGEMTPNTSGSVQRYLRDTQFADPLPQQVRDVTDLNQRIFQIRDAFGSIHVEGNIP